MDVGRELASEKEEEVRKNKSGHETDTVVKQPLNTLKHSTDTLTYTLNLQTYTLTPKTNPEAQH